MIKWNEWQKKNCDTHNRYERVTISASLKSACDSIKKYIIDKNVTWYNYPVTPPNYGSFIADNRYEFSCNLPAQQIQEWLDAPESLRAMSLPVRVITSYILPDEIVLPALAALEAQESVYEHAVIFRVIKLKPGDIMMLHYDPKSFYTQDKVWQKGHRGKYKDKRAFIYMNDRAPGQISYLGDHEIDFKAYDMFKYDVEKVYHGSCNFGYDDRFLITFSWAEPL